MVLSQPTPATGTEGAPLPYGPCQGKLRGQNGSLTSIAPPSLTLLSGFNPETEYRYLRNLARLS